MELIYMLNLEFNFSCFVKLFFIFLLVITHLILFVNEFSKPDELQIINQNLKSGIISEITFFKNLSAYSMTTLSLISGLKNIFDKTKSKNELKSSILKIEELEQKVQEIQAQTEAYKTDNAVIAEKITKIKSSLQNCHTDLSSILNTIGKNLELYTESSDSNSNVNSQIINKLNEKNLISAKRFEASMQEAISESDSIISLVDKTQKCSILLSDLLELLEKFDGIQRIYISLLIFNYIKISCCISILFIYYGNYLINKFNIEAKYPKLYKVLALRIKFQKYYLTLNISFIIIICLTEMVTFLMILF